MVTSLRFKGYTYISQYLGLTKACKHKMRAVSQLDGRWGDQACPIAFFSCRSISNVICSVDRSPEASITCMHIQGCSSFRTPYRVMPSTSQPHIPSYQMLPIINEVHAEYTLSTVSYRTIHSPTLTFINISKAAVRQNRNGKSHFPLWCGINCQEFYHTCTFPGYQCCRRERCA